MIDPTVDIMLADGDETPQMGAWREFGSHKSSLGHPTRPVSSKKKASHLWCFIPISQHDINGRIDHYCLADES
jgi:hypothetical protein